MNNFQRILLTGSSGSLGLNILKLLANRDDIIVNALVRQNTDSLIKSNNIFYTIIDYKNRDGVLECIKKFNPTCIIHSAASGMNFNKPEWFEMIRFNIDVSLYLLELASRLVKCKFVYISSGLIYKDVGRKLCEHDAIETLHPYGASKAAADILLRAAAYEFRVPIVILRPFSFTGFGDVGDRLFPSILRAATENRSIDLSPCTQVRDHCSVEDIASCVISASLKKTDSVVYNLGSGSVVNLRSLIEYVVSEINLKVELNFGKRNYLPYEPMFLSSNSDLVFRELGWKPKTNIAYSVWLLARTSFQSLSVKEPQQWL